MGNTLSQEEIDFLLNSGGFDSAPKPVPQVAAKTAEPAPTPVRVEPKTPMPPVKVPAPVTAVGSDHHQVFRPDPRRHVKRANPLGAELFDFQNNAHVRVLKGNPQRDYTIPSRSVWTVDEVRQLDLARNAVLRLLALSKRFREKKRHGLVHEVVHLNNRYGHKISFFLLRNQKKPIRLKVQDLPIFTLNHKMRSLERTIEWEFDEKDAEEFVYTWGQWFWRNFDEVTLEKMAQLA